MMEVNCQNFEVRSDYETSKFMTCSTRFYSSRSCVVQTPPLCQDLGTYPCNVTIQRHYRNFACKRYKCIEVAENSFDGETATLEVRFARQ